MIREGSHVCLRTRSGNVNIHIYTRQIHVFIIKL